MLRPLFHFLLIGLALFGVETALEGGGDARPPISGEHALSDDDLLFREALLAGVVETDVVVQRRLIRNLRFLGLEQEDPAASLRTALSLGLHETDPVVRRRLVQRARAAIGAAAREQPPAEAELRRRYASGRERFGVEARARVSHLFVRETHDERDRARADSLHAQVSDLRPDEAVRLGDPFLGGHHLALLSRREIERALGAAVADRAFRTAVASWSSPVRSVYGLHLLYVHEVVPRSHTPFADARGVLSEEWYAERERKRLRHVLDELRARRRGSAP